MVGHGRIADRVFHDAAASQVELGTVVKNPSTLANQLTGGLYGLGDAAFVEYPETCLIVCNYDWPRPIEHRRIANGDDSGTCSVTGSTGMAAGDRMQTTGVMSGEQTGIVMTGADFILSWTP